MNQNTGRNYVQYGCGICAPPEWENFDASPTLRIQKIPLFGKLVQSRLNVIFPSNVRYGNIVDGLPVQDNFFSGAYCSHTLEHLSYSELPKALNNTYKILREGSIFRCVVPDFEYSANEYINSLNKGNADASIIFMESTLLGVHKRPKGWRSYAEFMWGNSRHLWMWDYLSLGKALSKAGFTRIRRCSFGDCTDQMFKLVEDRGRFEHALAIECVR
jgi:hypothetical protein